MSTPLIIEPSPELQSALDERARQTGKSVPEIAREILEESLASTPLGLRIRHLRGVLDLPEAQDEGWRDRIRDRNWRE